MDCEQDASAPCAERGEQQQGQETQFDQLRQYNREYMRRWRADPGHQAHERGRRQQSYRDRKLRKGLQGGDPVCGICHLRRSIETVVRLQICESAPGGYVQIRIPYCGQC